MWTSNIPIPDNCKSQIIYNLQSSWQFWKSNNDNHGDLTEKSDTRKNSQFLQSLAFCMFVQNAIKWDGWYGIGWDWFNQLNQFGYVQVGVGMEDLSLTVPIRIFRISFNSCTIAQLGNFFFASLHFSCCANLSKYLNQLPGQLNILQLEKKLGKCLNSDCSEFWLP